MINKENYVKGTEKQKNKNDIVKYTTIICCVELINWQRHGDELRLIVNKLSNFYKL